MSGTVEVEVSVTRTNSSISSTWTSSNSGSGGVGGDIGIRMALVGQMDDPAMKEGGNRDRGRKRPSFRWGPRDASRDRNPNFKMGKPGSKRHQRFLNLSYLHSQESFVEVEDFIVFDTSYKTPLGTMLQNRELRHIWEQFLSVSDEHQYHHLLPKQNHLLNKIYGPSSSSASTSHNGSQHRVARARVPHHKLYHHYRHYSKYTNPHSAPPSGNESFNIVDRNLRKLLMRQSCPEFLKGVENTLLNYIHQSRLSLHESVNNSTDLNHRHPMLIYPFQQPYQRLICHGVCQYYSVLSKSKNTNNISLSNNQMMYIENSNSNMDVNMNTEGDGRIVIVESAEGAVIPDISLCQYLQNLQLSHSM